MMDFATLSTFFSALSFLFFGVSCLTTSYMIAEFIRYGHDRERPLVGVLQVLGGIGLLVGYYISPLIAAAAALGLCLMMVAGFAVRMKIGDSFLLATPAFLYALLNLYLTIHYAGQV